VDAFRFAPIVSLSVDVKFGFWERFVSSFAYCLSAGASLRWPLGARLEMGDGSSLMLTLLCLLADARGAPANLIHFALASRGLSKSWPTFAP